MTTVLYLLSGVSIVFGVGIFFAPGKRHMFIGLVPITGGVLAYEQHSFTPLAVGLGVLYALRMLGLEGRREEKVRSNPTQSTSRRVEPILQREAPKYGTVGGATTPARAPAQGPVATADQTVVKTLTAAEFAKEVADFIRRDTYLNANEFLAMTGLSRADLSTFEWCRRCVFLNYFMTLISGLHENQRFVEQWGLALKNEFEPGVIRGALRITQLHEQATAEGLQTHDPYTAAAAWLANQLGLARKGEQSTLFLLNECESIFSKVSHRIEEWLPGSRF